MESGAAWSGAAGGGSQSVSGFTWAVLFCRARQAAAPRVERTSFPSCNDSLNFIVWGRFTVARVWPHTHSCFHFTRPPFRLFTKCKTLMKYLKEEDEGRSDGRGRTRFCSRQQPLGQEALCKCEGRNSGTLSCISRAGRDYCDGWAGAQKPSVKDGAQSTSHHAGCCHGCKELARFTKSARG